MKAEELRQNVTVYVGKTPTGKYQPFLIERTMAPTDVEISDEVCIITRETTDAYREAQRKPEAAPATPDPQPGEGVQTPITPKATQQGLPIAGGPLTLAGTATKLPPSSGVRWSGDVPAQKWMNFYTIVLTRLGIGSGLKLTVAVEYKPDTAVSPQKIEEVRSALRELGLSDKLEGGLYVHLAHLHSEL